MGIFKAIWGFIRKNPLAAGLMLAAGFIAVMLLGGKVKEKLTEVVDKIKPDHDQPKA